LSSTIARSPAASQLLHDVAADVAGAAGHENRWLGQVRSEEAKTQILLQSRVRNMRFEPPVGARDTVTEFYLRLPAERREARGIEQLCGAPSGLLDQT
jgi:hypothetical protein